MGDGFGGVGIPEIDVVAQTGVEHGFMDENGCEERANHFADTVVSDFLE